MEDDGGSEITEGLAMMELREEHAKLMEENAKLEKKAEVLSTANKVQPTQMPTPNPESSPIPDHSTESTCGALLTDSPGKPQKSLQKDFAEAAFGRSSEGGAVSENSRLTELPPDLRILVADDQLVNRKILRCFFTKMTKSFKWTGVATADEVRPCRPNASFF
jgi:hypothetical protein